MWILCQLFLLTAPLGTLPADDTTSPAVQADQTGQVVGEKTLPSAGQQNPFSDWLSRQDYQSLFQSKVAQGLYPSTVEAQITDGSLKFRARFSARPNNTTFAFYSFHGISKSEYTRKTTSFKQAGFRELCVNSVVDEQGLKLFSGTWIRETRAAASPTDFSAEADLPEDKVKTEIPPEVVEVISDTAAVKGAR